MTTLSQITERLEKVLPVSMQDAWDHAGLGLGRKHQIISGILISYDVCLEVIREAVEKKCNLIISHHPFRMISSVEIIFNHYEDRIIEACLKNNIALYSCHTQHDNSPNSLNTHILKKLGIKKPVPLRPMPSLDNWGAGRYGDLPIPQQLNMLIKKLKNIFRLDSLRVVSKGGKKISRIGIVTGSGASLMPDAIKKGCDLFITGDVKYHQAVEALRSDLVLVDPGHFYSEIESIELLHDILKKIAPSTMRIELYKNLQDTFTLR